MRRVWLAAGILLLLMPLTRAESMPMGVGAFGGISIPIVQDDQGNGSVFGVMGRFFGFTAQWPNA